MGCNYALFPMAQEVGTQLFVKPHSNLYFLKSWGAKTFGYNNFKLTEYLTQFNMQLPQNVSEVCMLKYSFDNQAVKKFEPVSLQSDCCWNVYFTKVSQASYHHWEAVQN